MKKQLHAYFNGNVQGVGFRYTACRAADGFVVTGWIKNLKDGRVEMVAEGEESEIESFLKLLREKMQRNIQNMEVNWRPASGEWTIFETVY